MKFHGMNPEDARTFAARWLPAWTGNRPELLASFYTLDAVYSDPVIPGGLRGRESPPSILPQAPRTESGVGMGPPWLHPHGGWFSQSLARVDPGRRTNRGIRGRVHGAATRRSHLCEPRFLRPVRAAQSTPQFVIGEMSENQLIRSNTSPCVNPPTHPPKDHLAPRRRSWPFGSSVS